MTCHVIDPCPHCLKRFAKFRLLIADQPSAAPLVGFRASVWSSEAGQNVYGGLWVCQHCFKKLGASIFVAL